GRKQKREGAVGLGRPRLREPVAEEMEEGGAEEGGAGDGEYPRIDDAASNAPADGGEAASGADSDNGPGDGVGGADGDTENGVCDQGEAACGFRGETAKGSELGNALAHGLDDAPSASHGAAAHGEVA